MGADRMQKMNNPVRIQVQRKKGWKMPPNTVLVGRPSRWGNPFSAEKYGRDGAVAKSRSHLENLRAIGVLDLSELRGKNLACWCKPGEPCHADVLLEMANKGGTCRGSGVDRVPPAGGAEIRAAQNDTFSGVH